MSDTGFASRIYAEVLMGLVMMDMGYHGILGGRMSESSSPAGVT